MVRLQPDQLAMLDAWIASSSEGASRPEAIRMILVEYLNRRVRRFAEPKDHAGRADRVAHAKRLAGEQIDKAMAGKAVGDRATAKRKLTKALRPK